MADVSQIKIDKTGHIIGYLDEKGNQIDIEYKDPQPLCEVSFMGTCPSCGFEEGR